MSREDVRDVSGLARAIHERLRELEGGGVYIDVTEEMEEILLHDATYVPRRPSMQPVREPSYNAVERAAARLQTTVGALAGERPHTPVYSGPPSAAEEERRRAHHDAGGHASPFTALVFPPHDGQSAAVFIADFPMVQAFGATEEEALARAREGLDVLLTRLYEKTVTGLETQGRPFRREPFAFHPPGAGRTR
jgi:predicted RNase H-like HicB family nuclease